MYGSALEYALHCLLFLADGKSKAASSDLAQLQGLSPSYVAKLFVQLKRAGLVTASEGATGGYSLARSADAISVLQVADAVEGKKSLFDCKDIRLNCVLFGAAPPPWAKRTCSIHAVMLKAERELRDALASVSLGSLAVQFSNKAPPAFVDDVVHWLDARRKPARLAKPAS